jgi:hypothetical protein
MATERFKDRLSAAPTLFPTIVERLRQFRRVRRSVPSLQFPRDRLSVQSVKNSYVWIPASTLLASRLQWPPMRSRKKC